MSSLNRRRAEGFIVLIAGYLLVRAFWVVSNAAGRTFDSATIEATVKTVLWWCGGFPVALWLARRHDIPLATLLGFGPGVVRGLGFGLVATVPMIVALAFGPSPGFDLDLMFGSGMLGPVAEELLFRGFLFGVLWRAARWPAPAAIIVSSLVFGFAHQTNVLPMAAGGAVLAWIAYRWNSLWPAIGLHAGMNLCWDLLRIEHARPSLGLDFMSAAQTLSVVAAILVTIRFSASVTTSAPGPSGARNELTLANDI